MNVILLSDSYKYTHYKQYPKNTKYMHSYLESRGGSKTNVLLPVTRFFGLQYYLKKYFTIKITKEMVEEANEILCAHGVGFDYNGWMIIVNEYDGLIPLKIRAVQEGAIIQRKNVLMTIESTDSRLFWLVGWAETLLMKVWYPTTVATLSYNMHKMIEQFMERTCDNMDKLPFMLHDFGYRGASSEESAMIGAMAHLTVFSGTDTVAGIVGARKYYAKNNSKIMPGFSIPASEHSTITSWGAGSECEKNAFTNMVEQFAHDYNLFACVSDSWNFDVALKTWATLKDKIVEQNSCVVVRPDSGDAKQNVLRALKELEHSFGYYTNTKGFKVLKNAAIIQGDGVNSNQIYDILLMMEENGYSADNIAFGMGGALLQGNSSSSVNRDTHKFAIKCSAVMIEDDIQDVYKDPITDSGKKSKKGRLDLLLEDGEYKTIKLCPVVYGTDKYHPDSVLKTYYENGNIYCDYDLNELKNKM
jgi:nicotinamide phosphoribosyltransferase